MNAVDLAPLLLRARLRLTGSAAVPAAVLALCAAGLLARCCLLTLQLAPPPDARATPVPPAHYSPPAMAAPAPAGSASERNVALFYAMLGQQADSEQQLRTLFTLAARSGLLLKQGDYRLAFDRSSRIATYDIVLPVKGSYQQVWEFSSRALHAMPYAALDEITFHREAIGDATPEARLHLTLFLQPVTP